MNELIKKPDQAALIEALDGAKVMASIVPTDAESATIVNQNLKAIAKTTRDLDALRKTYTDPLNRQAKSIKAEFDKVINQLKGFRTQLEQAHFAYNRKVEEEQRQRIEEQKRIDAEREAAEAEKAAAREGLSPAAAALLDDIDETDDPPVREVSAPTLQLGASAGVQTRKSTKVTVVNPLLVLQAIIDGDLPLDVVKINESAIARYLKNSASSKAPGCDVSTKESVAA